jgi:apolipoprotein N-acyltransferase
VGFIPLLRAIARGLPPAGAARAGFLAGCAVFGLVFGWVPFADVGGRIPLHLAYLLVIPALAALFALFAFLVAALARRAPALALASAPGLWVALEYARSQEWVIAVPWGHLGYGLAEWPALAQGARFAGLYGLSFWIVAVNAGLLLAPRLGRLPRALLGAALVAPVAPGLALLAPAPGTTGDVVRVGAVQPAVPEAERHRPESFQSNLRRLLDLSEQVRGERPDVVVWPESAYERALGPGGDAFLAAVAHHLERPVLAGVWRAPVAAGEAWRNAAVLATTEGLTRAVAEKVHPLPVYERAPEGRLARALARRGLWTGRFAPGAPGDPVAVEPADGGAPVPVGVLVCIDASHPELAWRLREAGARVLVTLANEAGTGRWSAALHARAARLRAIENGVPVVRVANTGPTLWIDARGRVGAALPPGGSAGAHAVAVAGAPAAPRPPDAAVAAAATATAATALAAVAVPGRHRPRFPARAPRSQRLTTRGGSWS